MSDRTIIYYSSGREDPIFEQKIIDKLIKSANGVPIVSVTQKPMKLRTNICVGDVGVSDYNIYKQMQIACEAVKTQFVITAEADCLYPPTGYFDFIPPDSRLAYHYTNLWVLFKGRPVFRRKAYSLCGLFTNREFLLSRIERSIKHSPRWKNGIVHPRPLFHRYQNWTPFSSTIPIVNMKTGNGQRWHTGTDEVTIDELPCWGKASELLKTYDIG